MANVVISDNLKDEVLKFLKKDKKSRSYHDLSLLFREKI